MIFFGATLGKKVRYGPLLNGHGPGVDDICMHIDALLLLLFKRFSAVSQTKYNFFPNFRNFKKSMIKIPQYPLYLL